MPQLSFRINAEWDKVQRLREEIAKLKQEIKGTDALQSPLAFNTLNAKLVQTSQELGKVEEKIISASAKMETDFKQKIYAASQGVNDFTEKIIAQKGAVREAQDQVRKLADAYREAKKAKSGDADSIFSQWKNAKLALDSQRSALFGLTQEQAAARLSVKRLNDEYKAFRQEGGGTAQTMDLLSSKMKGIAATVMGGMGLKELASRIISVRAEFESMETSLKVLLGGSQERLNNIMGQIKEYALASPLNTKDMVGAVQMMAGFGIEAEKSIDYLKAMGDISMGNTQKFNSMVLAFSQMSATGKLMGGDLNQLINAGFNPLEEISRKTGKSIGELKEEMSKGAISAKMVQDAFISVTSAGGKFYGMASEGAKTLNGQISMLQESFDNMFNEIGSKGEGVVIGAVKAGTFLVENYQTIGKIVEGLVLTYGIYRTGIALNIVLEKAHAANMTVTGYAIDALKTKWAALNATALLNPYVMAAAALAAFGMSLYEVSKRTDTASAALDRLNDANEQVTKSSEIEINKLNVLRAQLEQNEKGTDKWKAAKDAIIEQYGQYDSKLAAEINRTGTLTSSYENLTIAIRKSVAARQLKQFYDNNVQETQDDIQKRRSSIYKGLSREYGQQTTNLLMKYVNQYALTGQGLDTKLSYKKNGKIKKTTVRNMINNVHGDFFSMGGGAEARQMRELQLNSDKALADFVAMNGISEKEKNEILYGVKPTDDKKTVKSGITKKDLQDQKKALQAQLDGLSEIEAKGKKGAALKKKIAAITARENAAYSTSSSSVSGKTGKGGNANTFDPIKAQSNIDAQKATLSQAQVELENQVEQARIDVLDEGSGKTLAAMKLAHKKEMEQIDKQKEDYLKKKQDEAEAEFKADPKNKDKTFNRSTVTLSADEQTKFDALRADTLAKQANEEREHQRQQIDALNAYLKEYGTMQERRLAITAEYDEKIRKAQSEGEKATLDAERKRMLAELDIKALQASIDWEDVFSDMDRHSTAYLKAIREKLRATLNAKDITAENAKVLTEKIRDIEDTIGERTDIWSAALPGLRERLRLTEEVARAEEAAAKAGSEAIAADVRVLATKQAIQDRLKGAGVNASLGDITAESKDRLMANVSKGSDVYDALMRLFENLATDTSKAGVAREKAAKTEAKKASVLDKIGSVSKITDFIPWAGKGATFGQVVDGINANAQSMADLTDTIGLGNTDFGEAVHNFADGVGNFSGVVSSLASGDIFGAVNGVIKGFQSFGRVFGIGGGNAEAVNKSIDRLTERNELLTQAIEDLTDEMEKASGANAIRISSDVEKLQRETIGNYMKIAQEQASYHHAHNSFNKEWRGFTGEQVGRLSSQIGRQWDGNLWDLSPEEMKKLRSNVDMWERIEKTGKGGYGGRVADKLEDYIAQAGKLEGITDALYEKLTTTTEDNVFDDFLTSLHDLADGSEDVFSDIADNWQRMVNEMVVNNLVGAKFQGNLEGWYEKLAKLNRSRTEGSITDAQYKSQLDSLKATYDGYVRSAQDEIRQLRAAGIISPSGDAGQKATANGATEITYEQANNIVALTTAGNVTREQIKDIVTLTNAKIDDFKSVQVQTKNIADELRTIQANSYIELQGIHDDTTAMSKAMKSMSIDVSDIKKKIKDM